MWVYLFKRLLIMLPTLVGALRDALDTRIGDGKIGGGR